MYMYRATNIQIIELLFTFMLAIATYSLYTYVVLIVLFTYTFCCNYINLSVIVNYTANTSNALTCGM